MKLQRRISLLLVAAVLAVFVSATTFWSCDNTFHVFDDIQTELRQIGTDIFKNATVKALGDDGINYYTAMAKIWYRPIAGGDWKILPLGLGTVDTDYYAYSLVSGGAAALYVAVEKNGPAVYKGTAAGTTWTAVPLGSLDGLSLDELYFANNTLFALAHNGTGAAVKYSLHYSNGTAAFASTTLIDLPTALIGVSHDGAADFLASTSTTVYKFTGVAGARSEVTPGSAKTFGGIAADHDNHIHLSTQDGYLYTYSAGAWSTAKTIKAKQALGMVQEVETTPGSGVYRLLIAHASAGYYEYDKATEAVLDGTSSDTAFGTPASSYTTTIYGKAVLAVHSASTGNEILIGLASQGSSTGYALYSNKYASGTWSGWSAE